MIRSLLPLIYLLFACNGGGDFSLTKSRKAGGKNAKALDMEALKETAFGATSPNFLKAKFKLSVKKGSLTVCDSEIEAQVSSRMGMDGNPLMILNEEIIECKFGIKIDLTHIFAGFATKVGLDTANDLQSQLDVLKTMMELEADKETIFLKKMYMPPIVDSTFQPPRAFLPNIIAGSEDELANYNLTQEFTATDNIRNRSDSGFVHVTIDEWAVPYTPEFLRQSAIFDDTAKISIGSSGFDDVNTLRTFIPTNMVMQLSRNPVAILQIDTKTNIFDALVGGVPDSEKLNKLETSKEDGRFWGRTVAKILDGDSLIELSLLEQEGLENILEKSGQRETTNDLE